MELIDFLYSDHERVASFLAQINGLGSLIQNEEKSSKAKSDSKKGELKAGFLSGGAGQNIDYQKEVRLNYDPLWSNSRKFIDFIRESGAENKKNSDVGDLVILNGKLLCYDLSALTAMMNSDAMIDFIAAGIEDRDEFHGRSKKAIEEIKKNEASVIRSLLKELPLGLGFVFVTDAAHYWFSVKRDCLSLRDLDVPLKFPAHISGEWNVIGIVDAKSNDHINGLEKVMKMEIDGLLPAMPLNMLQLVGVISGMFGRPYTACGLSPLIVFREVLV